MKVPKKIETPRLVLRRLIADDIDPFYKFLSDSHSTKYMAFADEQKTLEGATAMVEATIESYDTEDAIFVLSMILKDQGIYIGSLGASPDPDTDGIEIFYTLMPDYRGQGFATESVRHLIAYLREQNIDKRIVAYIMTGNDASFHVAESVGMVFDARVERDGHKGSRYILDDR